MGPEDWDDLDIGEGAYYSDEENKWNNEGPYPDELWDEEFKDIE